MCGESVKRRHGTCGALRRNVMDPVRGGGHPRLAETAWWGRARPGEGAITDESRERRNERDLELVQQVRAGSRTAFEKLFEAWLGPVHALARRRCGPERAERVAEAALTSVFASLDDYRGEVPLAAWILGHTLRAARETAGAPAARPTPSARDADTPAVSAPSGAGRRC